MTSRTFARRRFLLPAAAVALLIGFSSCTGTQIREERYGDGSRKSQASFARKSDNAYLRHGVQIEWHPSGKKAAMETYVNGYRQGYAFLWHDNGKLKSLVHYTDGIQDGQSKYWDGNGNLVACFSRDAEDCLLPVALENHAPNRLAVKP